MPRFLSLGAAISKHFYRGYKLFRLLPNIMAGRPRVAEYDLSGVVVDANGTRFKNGDHVFGWVPSSKHRNPRAFTLFLTTYQDQARSTNQGALMEYCKLSANWLVNRPPNVTPIQSASFSLTGLTAYEVIFNRCDVQPGQRLFINGGSTSVGIFAIQLAKIRGAHVTVSASGGKEDLLRSLGADEVRRQSFIQDSQYL